VVRRHSCRADADVRDEATVDDARPPLLHPTVRRRGERVSSAFRHPPDRLERHRRSRDRIGIGPDHARVQAPFRLRTVVNGPPSQASSRFDHR
jgi:hypothetical protein